MLRFPVAPEPRELEKRCHSGAVVVRPRCAGRRIVMGADHQRRGLSPGERDFQVAHGPVTRIERLPANLVTERFEFRFDGARGCFELLRRASVVLGARDGRTCLRSGRGDALLPANAAGAPPMRLPGPDHVPAERASAATAASTYRTRTPYGALRSAGHVVCVEAVA